MIEPCPFCGSEVSIGDFERISCPACCYRGGVLMDSIAQHNRLSRIVRAAEEWARLLPHGPSGEYVKAVNALFEAVEGGRADG
jgi:hypothetical protein